MQYAYSVADVREAESAAMKVVGPDALMQNAAFGLAVSCSRLLMEAREQVVGSRITILTGTGSNGGDALWAGSLLVSRGASVVAIAVGDKVHDAGAAALVSAGGRLINLENPNITKLIEMSDLVLDGILGIGGRGALDGAAARLAATAANSEAIVVAVDLPSGIDADTGAVADKDAAVRADVTVTFGCLKPGLLVTPGSDFVGSLQFVDIGLEKYLPQSSNCRTVEVADTAARLPAPGADDNKYSRGVVGVVAGSDAYPGAGVLCTGAARLGGAGMVRYAGGARDAIAAHWPEVVLEPAGPQGAGRVQVWVVGPGGGTDDAAHARLAEALEINVPVVVDADGLTLLAQSEGLRAQVAKRGASGLITILTPHEGEFARLGFELSSGAAADRVGSVVAAAKAMNAVILLKGHHTIVGEPGGIAFVNTVSDSALATAGSGDVLAGLLGSILASDVSKLETADLVAAAESAACAAFVHGTAGLLAARGDEPVTASTVLEAIPDAIATIRHDGSHG